MNRKRNLSSKEKVVKNSNKIRRKSDIKVIEVNKKEEYKCHQCLVKIDTKKNYLYLPEFDYYFHTEDFKCNNCSILLENNYLTKNENFYCKICYNNKYYNSCNICNDPIIDELVTVNNEFYHDNCFKCYNCKIVLKGKVYEKLLKNYCYSCFIDVSKICNKCKEPIVNEYYEIDNCIYHKDCFICGVCNNNLEDFDVIINNEVPFHINCYNNSFGKKCFECSELIDGKYKKLNSNNYHIECN